MCIMILKVVWNQSLEVSSSMAFLLSKLIDWHLRRCKVKAHFLWEDCFLTVPSQVCLERSVYWHIIIAQGPMWWSANLITCPWTLKRIHLFWFLTLKSWRITHLSVCLSSCLFTCLKVNKGWILCFPILIFKHQYTNFSLSSKTIYHAYSKLSMAALSSSSWQLQKFIFPMIQILEMFLWSLWVIVCYSYCC